MTTSTTSPLEPATAPTPEQIIAGFAPALTPAAKIEAMLAAVPAEGDLALVARLPTGRVFTYSPASVPVVINMLGEALDRTSTHLPSAWPIFAARFGDNSNGSGGAAMIAGSFATIGFDRVVADTHKGFNSSDNIYVVPQNGVYDVSLKFRIADGDIAGASYGVGVAAEATDSPSFAWTTGASKRQGAQYRTTAAFKAGDRLRAFYYFDGVPPRYTSAELTILRVR